MNVSDAHDVEERLLPDESLNCTAENLLVNISNESCYKLTGTCNMIISFFFSYFTLLSGYEGDPVFLFHYV